MWPLNFSASCILLVLDFNNINSNNQSDDEKAKQLSSSIHEVCTKALDATRTMVDFSPSTISAGNTLNPSNLVTSSSSSGANNNQNNNFYDSSTLSNFERPAGAIYAVLVNSPSHHSHHNEKCVCLWSPIGNESNNHNENEGEEVEGSPDYSGCRSGETIREVVKRRLANLLLMASTSSSSSVLPSSHSTTPPVTLEGLVRCTGTVRQLQVGSQQQQQNLPALIRVISSNSTSTSTTSNQNESSSFQQHEQQHQKSTTTTTISTDWRDSVCSLISTWENLNIKVSIEAANSSTTANTITCPVLKYLIGVSSSSSTTNQTSSSSSSVENAPPSSPPKTKKFKMENAFQLTFVCPKCRSMVVPTSSTTSSSSPSMNQQLLSIIALQEPPKCPQGCKAW